MIDHDEEAKFYAKKGYYDHTDFTADLIKFMAPDASQYIRNMLYSFCCAEESRDIIFDICNTIAAIRIKTGKYCSSAGYSIGNKSVDGRAYAYRNIREWCAYIGRSSDSIAQFLNIILGLGMDSNFVSPQNVQEKIKKYKELSRLCCQLQKIIQKAKDIDNYSKHTLNYWGKEKHVGQRMESVEYYISMPNFEISASELMKTDRMIEETAIKIIDEAMKHASPNNNPDRYYIICPFDFERNGSEVEVFPAVQIPSERCLSINFNWKKCPNGSIICVAAEMTLETKPKPCIYLAGIYEERIQGMVFLKIGNILVDEITVLNKAKCVIGNYKADSNPPLQIHFKRFKYVPV